MPESPLLKRTLTVDDHSRDAVGFVYVYPVVSRRAGGVSVGINLNPNNACNWRCVYCQVPNLQRGGPPAIDLLRLGRELDSMLDDILIGDFLSSRVTEGKRRLIDIAFSGNGEPTSSADFPLAVELAVAALIRRKLLPDVKLRLITNGSLLDRRSTRVGIARMGEIGGEVWFKVDAGEPRTIARVNGVRLKLDSIERRLRECSKLCSTWVQTCLFAQDGELPPEAEIDALVDFLGRLGDAIRGVHLYGLARPSAQPEAGRLTPVPTKWLGAVATRLEATGLTVHVSP